MHADTEKINTAKLMVEDCKLRFERISEELVALHSQIVVIVNLMSRMERNLPEGKK